MSLDLTKHTALIFMVVLLCFDNVLSQDAENSSNDLSLELIPTSDTYELDKGYDGETIYKDKLNFNAVIKNYTDSTIIIAHPTACAPDSSDNPPPWSLEDRINKAEILLYITEPDGNKVLLREGGFTLFEGVSGAERSNIPYIMIPPDSSRSFAVGWFFLNARLPKWVGDVRADQVFKQKGEFEVQLVCTNVYTSSCIDFGIDDYSKLSTMLWTGTLVSNTVKITMK